MSDGSSLDDGRDADPRRGDYRTNPNAKEGDRCSDVTDCSFYQDCVDYNVGGIKACIRR